jgi:TonB-dependent Receptor Plug Domain
VVTSDVLVTVGSEGIIDFKLRPGEVQTKIEVSGTSPAIQLASSTLEATENSMTIRELPLNGRDWTTLAQLQPGVAGVYQYPLALSNQRSNRGLGTQLSIGGMRPQGNNYRLDGITINDYSNGGPGSVLGILLGVEAIQEFSVVTCCAPASYGRTSGGVIPRLIVAGECCRQGFLANAPPWKEPQSGPRKTRPSRP